MAAVLSGCTSGEADADPHGSAPDHIRVLVAHDTCRVGVTQLRSGVSIFDVRNSSRDNASFVITRGGDQPVGAVQSIAPGSIRTLAVELERGRYQARCAADQREGASSASLTVTGRAVNSTSHSTALRAAAGRYLDYFRSQVAPLKRSMQQFAGSLKQGRPDIAHDTLIVASGYWKRLSIAVDAERDAPLWEAFNRELWSSAITPQVTASADVLVQQVNQALESGTKNPPTALEIAQGVDNAVHDFVATRAAAPSGDDAQWRTTTRATFEGAHAAIKALTPVLSAQDPQLLDEVSDGLENVTEASSSESTDEVYDAAAKLAEPMGDVAVAVAQAARAR